MIFAFESIDPNGDTTKHRFEADRWDEALNQFVKFLRGSGYRLEDDSIGVNLDKHPFMQEDYELLNIAYVRSEDCQPDFGNFDLNFKE